jgi:DNA-binding transcriptional regulator YbjK
MSNADTLSDQGLGMRILHRSSSSAAQDLHDVTLEERRMRKSEQISDFKTYLNERQRMTTATLSEIEKAGIEAALDRCRALAHRIRGDLRNKRPEHFVSVWSLADFQVSLERAASVLEQKSRRSLSKKSE